MKILLVDDEEIALKSVKMLLSRKGIRDVNTCSSGKEAIGLIKKQDYDIVLLDLIMPEVDGLEVLKETKPFKPDTEFIILTAVDEVPTTVKALKLGAYDYLVKPTDSERLLLTLKNAYEHKGLMTGKAGSYTDLKDKSIPEEFSHIIANCPRMRELLSYADVMARSDIPILITGETGTGKEMVTLGIHRASPYRDGPFIPVNVSAIPEALFESQFFGHVKGAFTGAIDDHTGFFEQADKGSLFLDEIGELPYNLQSKILRAIEESRITRIGGKKSISFNARIISATNKNLDEACREKSFRLDLLYRLKSAHIHLPPLRERKADLPLLMDHLLKTACEKYKKDIRGLSREAMDLLRNMVFPGNIRELSQLITKAVLAADSDMIYPYHLGEEKYLEAENNLFEQMVCCLKDNEDKHVVYVLKNTGGDKNKAAETLGISLRQLQRKISALKNNPRWDAILSDI
ncbi:sigma-54-dependent transcriptional regulator [candidate division KSB1 bacterium]